MRQLKKFYLNENQLTIVPPEIGNLQQLELLELYANQLTSLPPEIGNLWQLKNLSLHNNQLVTLPIELFGLEQLQRLDLQMNQLKYPAPRLMRYCRSRGRKCDGIPRLPSLSCSAFGSMALSFDFTSCVRCDLQFEVTIGLLVLFLILGILILWKLDTLSDRYPGSVGGSIASICIVISHAQMMDCVPNDLE